MRFLIILISIFVIFTEKAHSSKDSKYNYLTFLISNLSKKKNSFSEEQILFPKKCVLKHSFKRINDDDNIVNSDRFITIPVGKIDKARNHSSSNQLVLSTNGTERSVKKGVKVYRFITSKGLVSAGSVKNPVIEETRKAWVEKGGVCTANYCLRQNDEEYFFARMEDVDREKISELINKLIPLCK